MGIRELERQIALKKEKIANFTDKLLDRDKFTQQDELLADILNETRETNQLLVLTNRILFTLLKSQFGENMPELESLEGIGGSNYRTRVLRIDNIKDFGRLISLKGSGVISEIELISDDSNVNNKVYSVRIVADDNICYDNSWDIFETRNMHEADMTAFDDTNNGKYVLLFQDICYDESFYLEVYESAAKFDYINVKYHEKIGLM